MNQRTIGAIIAVVVVLALVGAMAIIFARQNQVPTQNPPAGGPTQEEATQEESTFGSPEVKSGEVAINIRELSFQPASVTVKKGTKVTWANKDTVEHTVTADQASPNAPNSDTLSEGESYSFTFNEVGTYSYHCTPHPQMEGTVTVVE